MTRSPFPLPVVPGAFYWTDESWGPALRCRPLDAVAPHLFTTRQLELSESRSVGELAASLGARGVAMLNQVHGRTVIVVRDDEVPPVPQRFARW